VEAIQTILLVDDDQDDQFVFMEALNSVNPRIKVTTANDGIDGLAKLETATILPEIIFVDLNMPRMNGKTFLKEIKSHNRLSGIPVIVYSTSSRPEDITETKALGADDFITKPNNYDELCQVLSSTISKTKVE
jgi:CheY-like chemotaxis protein